MQILELTQTYLVMISQDRAQKPAFQQALQVIVMHTDLRTTVLCSSGLQASADPGDLFELQGNVLL